MAIGRILMWSKCALKASRNVSTAASTGKSLFSVTCPPVSTDDDHLTIMNKQYIRDPWTNVPSSVLSKIGRNIYRLDRHPLSLLIQKIRSFYESGKEWARRPLYTSPDTLAKYLLNNEDSLEPSSSFGYRIYDDIPPVVTVQENFDSLCFPKNHPSRSPSDSYYVNEKYLLRTHMTAHESLLLSKDKMQGFISIGDVYRRDEIDSIHYPVFHQLEMVRKFLPEEIQVMKKAGHLLPVALDGDGAITQWIVMDLKRELSRLVSYLLTRDPASPEVTELSPGLQWIDGEFPFTFPSFELEFRHGDSPSKKPIELLGCGLLQQSILKQSSPQTPFAWAAGFGLERLAMILYDIPDIRLFWSTDERFLEQFDPALTKSHPSFKPFSRYPPISRDVSFWVNKRITTNYTPLVMEIIREEAGDLVEKATLVAHFPGFFLYYF